MAALCWSSVRRAANLALVVCALALIHPAMAGATVFWANKYQDAIGRADADGGSPDDHFIPLDANSHPVGVAQDAGHVYWTSYEAPDTIGRAALDGGDVRQAFITGASDPVGLAVDGAHVYWTNSRAGSIGRANLVGGGVTQRFITGLSRPYGLAVDAGHIYWSGETDGTIGRANLDGTCQEPSFMR